MSTYVFPGQGSQTLGMGGELFSEFPEIVTKANQILGYSLPQLCLQEEEKMNKTEFTQPALYAVSCLSYLKHIKTNPKPNFVAGHSLGEYNALFAAGVFDFETGLMLVKARGDLMSEVSGGGMAAIIGIKSGEILAILKEKQFNRVVIANYNTYTQSVISGTKEDIAALKPHLEERGGKFIPLKVSGAFHSPFMAKAREQFLRVLNQFNFKEPDIPVIANLTAKPYENNHIISHLADQMTHSVQWLQSVEYLLNLDENDFMEIGPGKVLTNLIRRIQKGQ